MLLYLFPPPPPSPPPTTSDVDCVRATDAESPRPALWRKKKKKLERNIYLLLSTGVLSPLFSSAAHRDHSGATAAQCAQVLCAPPEQALDRRSTGIFFCSNYLLISTWEAKVTDLLELLWSMTRTLGSEVTFGEL